MALAHLPAIAYAVRQQLVTQGIALTTGHAQQLIVAALGHNNLASFQASGDDPGFALASDIVLDPARLESRAADLQHDPSPFGAALVSVLEQLYPAATRHADHEEWLMGVEEYFAQAIVDDDRVNSEVSMTNGTFPRAFVELTPWWEAFDKFDGEDLFYDFNGTVKVDQDPDRIYYGDEVEVSAILTVERFGRRLFGRRDIEVTRAKLRWLGEPSSAGE